MKMKNKHGVVCSQKMEEYFDGLFNETNNAFEIASEARLKNFDNENFVEVKLAKNKAERVVGLISIVAPQIVGCGVVERIIELEKKYGSNDWRVSLIIALEIAKQKYCKFDDELNAMEVGIRTGFAYNTDGVVSSPIEGFTKLILKDRRDGKGKYFALNFSGPIRNAGGTGASTCVIIADYVRKNMNYETYDPDEKEIARLFSENSDYHERVANLQYFPSRIETDFLISHLPVEIDGDPTDRIEVSNYKDLPRIATNFLRGGYCLIMSSCIPLKAEKLWKQLDKWGDELGMGHWSFLKEYISIKKKAKAKNTSTKNEGPKPRITPDYTFVADIVAGRPVYGYPLSNGSFRMRLGRSRVTGLSAQGMSPATMGVLNSFIACGTQLKMERPGKAASFCSVDTIEGPVIKLKNGDVVYVTSLEQGNKLYDSIEEIIYLGDILCCYGDFLNRAHSLIPLGYCEEWWIQDLKHDIESINKKIDFDKISKQTKLEINRLKDLFENFMTTFPNFNESFILAKTYNSYLHPKHTYHFNSNTFEKTIEFLIWLKDGQINGEGKLVLPLQKNWNEIETEKRYLELIGIEHTVVQNEFVVLNIEKTNALLVSFGLYNNFNKKKIDEIINVFNSTQKEKKETDDIYSFNILNAITKISNVKLRDKSGVFVGARMGRPEKAKMRKIPGSPHGLFPVGKEGGRMKTFASALDVGFVNYPVKYFFCTTCNEQVLYSSCHKCGNKTEVKDLCRFCGSESGCEHFQNKTEEEIEAIKVPYKKTKINFREYFKSALKNLNTNQFADLIKGQEDLKNKSKYVERLEKAVLRAKHNIYVNKDGTIRYDASEVPITHFRPKEIKVPWKKLKEIGYDKDIYGNELNNDDQVLEIYPQDILIPCYKDSSFEGADSILFRTSKFIDELLVNLYGMEPYYNCKTPLDLVGKHTIVLAPHVSAGILTRIIGFTETQGLYAHPYVHCATRRDCDGDEAAFFLLMDAFLNFSKTYLPAHRGSTMDAPFVLTSILNPAEVDDMVFDMDISWNYPRELYLAGLDFKMPWDIKIETIKDHLGAEKQFEKSGFTHDTIDLNDCVPCSAYKYLPSMIDKLEGQLDLAKKIRAVKTEDVAELVVEKHFVKDLKGNLRGFSQQQFRCVKCNHIFRRPPLDNKCSNCPEGKIIFTIAEGSVIKYLGASINIMNTYACSSYQKENIELLRRAMDSVFGREKEIQKGLSGWFN